MGEEIRKEIEELLKQKNKIVVFEKKIEQMNEMEQELQKERDKFTDKESGFYKDAKKKLQGLRDLRNACIRVREIEKHKLQDEIKRKKTEIVPKLQEKLKMIDENRKTKVEEQLKDLKKEQEELERQIALNDVRGEAFDALNPEERQEVIMAYRNVLNNKHRLNDILLKIAIVETLDGKEPRDKYLEISEILAEIEERFTYDNIDMYKEDFDKIEENNIEEPVVDEQKLEVEEISAIAEDEIEEVEETEEEKVSEEKSEMQKETIIVEEEKDSFKEFLLTPVAESIRKIQEEQIKLEESENEDIHETKRVEMSKKQPKTEFDEFLLTPVAESIRKIQEEQKQEEQIKEQQKEAKPEAKPEVKKSEAKPEIKPEVKKSEAKPEIKPEVKPQPKPEVKPEVKPQPKPEVKPEVKPQAKQSESKPIVKPQVRTASAKKLINNHSIVATYIAKDRDYLMKNMDVKTGKGKPTERKINEVLDIAKGDNDYGEKLQQNNKVKNFENLDITFLNALMQIDDRYDLNKAQIYFNVVTNPEKYGSPKEIKKYMKDNNLKIVYDLRGIFDEPENEKMAMSDADRKRMLQLANNAKKLGIAKVKKGLKVSVLEAINGIKSNKTKMLKSAEKEEKRKIKNEPKKQAEKKRFTGKISDYMKEMKVEIKNDIKTMARKLNDFADRMKVDTETERRLMEVAEKAAMEEQENDIEEQETEEVK